ncbi:hypothetical protein [Sphingobacterium siyangense]
MIDRFDMEEDLQLQASAELEVECCTILNGKLSDIEQHSAAQ